VVAEDRNMTESFVARRRLAISLHGERTVRRRLADGIWASTYRGVCTSSDANVIDRIRAARESVGEDLVVVGPSAAAMHGLDVVGTDVVHLAGDSAKTARSREGLQIHGWRIPADDVVDVDGTPVTTAARTVVDLTRMLTRMDALPVVDAALSRRVSTRLELAAQLERHARRRGVVAAREMIALGDPRSESPMESRLRLRLHESDLPAPQLQWWLTDASGAGIYRLDFAWPEHRIGLEYDGAIHLERRQQRIDIERRNWLARAGWTVVGATDVDVYRNPGRLIAHLRLLLSRPIAA